MAEYYPLLAKAVAGRHHAPAAERQAIYDRARQALLGQLRSMNIPLDALERERVALDAAISRVEDEVEASVAASAPAMPAVAAPAVATPPPQPAPPAPPVVAAPAAAAPATATPRPAPSVTRAAMAPAVSPTAPVRPRPPRPAADALSRIVAERASVSPAVRVQPRPEPERATSSPEPPRPAPPLPSAPTLQVPSFADILAATTPSGAEREEEAPAASVAAPEESLRPQAPRPMTRERFNPRFLILTVVGVLVVAGIAYAAWRLRDKPDTLARTRAAMLAAQQAEEQQTAKVSARADTPAAATKTNPVPAAAPTPSTPTLAAATAAIATPAADTPPASQASTLDPAATATDTPPVNGAGASTAADPGVPVAQRAAFLVDAPDDPQKVKTYVGTVIWSVGTSSPAQNQPIAQTVHADITVPEAALKLSMVLQKNFEAQFPASHTLEFDFTLGPANALGPLKQINAPQMRQDSAPAGDPLIGLPVTITENHFLVGLSRGDATARNLDLIHSRNWFDVPILLASGRVAKITFEKGTTGQKIVDSVLQSWQ